jgi:integrase
MMRLVSTFFSDLVERGLASRNPAKMLPRSTRRLIRPAHDPRTTPFLESMGDVRRVFLALHEPLNIAFAVGATGGLRTGEILALKWAHVDLPGRRIHVRESIGGPLKDEDSRMVPIQDALYPILADWRLRARSTGLVIPTMKTGSKRCGEHSLGRNLRRVLGDLKLPALTWYQATRHTMASQFVMGGGSIEELREILGHSSVVVTERYSHVRPDLFGEKHRTRLAVDLTPAKGKILSLPGPDQVQSGAAWVQEEKTATKKIG